MKILYSLIIPIFLLAGCNKPQGYSIAASLEMASENEGEIQKALDYFPEGSDECNALRFLVERMINHSSYDGYANMELCKLIKTTENFDFKKIEWDFLSRTKEPKLYPDLTTVSADYLIKNVSEAYDTWANCHWKEEIDFSHFCEYMLPYKIGNEPIVEWRTYLKNKYGFLVEGVTTQKEAFFKIYEYVNSRYNGPKFDYPYEQDAILLDLAEGGLCKERAYHMIYIMRALGLSVSLDYTPVWSNYGKNAHLWVALVENNDNVVLPSYSKDDFHIDTAYEPVNYPIPENYHYSVDSLKKVAKILRRSFSAREENTDIDWLSTPSTFRDITVHDVTSSYCSVSKNSIIEIQNPTSNSLYTCTYSYNTGWYPVGKAKAISSNQVEIGPLINESVVLIAEYINGELIPRSDPHIIYSTEKKHQLRPDTINRQNIKIYRKYIFSSRWINRWGELIGTAIETSSFPNFINSECLYKWTQMPYEVSHVEIDTTRLKRYLRILPAKNRYPTLAEIQLRDKHGEKIPTTEYRIFAVGEGLTGDSLVIKSLQDNDEKTTFFKLFPFWIGIDLKHNRNIKELEIIMRNDENRIKPGYRYELFYFDNNWISLGEKISTDDYIEYNNVPTNTIFLIKNLEEGTEERIFTYENGIQIWW